VTADLLPALRSLLAAQPAGSGAHATLERAVAEVERLREELEDTQRLLEERSGLLVMRVGELNKARDDHRAWCDKHSGEIQERNAHFEREVEKATGFWAAKNGALAGDLRLMQARAEEAERRAAEHAAEVERLRARRSFQEQVAEFHRALDFPVRDAPTVPSDDEVRLRARLIAEEFFEVMAAMFPILDWDERADRVRYFIDEAIVGPVDLPALVHELADLHYVVSGTAVQLGIDEAPVIAAVHVANVNKAGGGKDERGKARKPDGWAPADVSAVLRAQGWTGGEEPR
jgi:predicted HAD superfamily Cof-like phosphohydrolase